MRHRWTWTGFAVVVLAAALRGVPVELLEAARMDGAGEFRIFFSVVLPVLKPVLVTLAVFAFLGSWNDFMWPLIVLSNADLQTLPVACRSATLAGLIWTPR